MQVDYVRCPSKSGLLFEQDMNAKPQCTSQRSSFIVSNSYLLLYSHRHPTNLEKRSLFLGDQVREDSVASRKNFTMHFVLFFGELCVLLWPYELFDPLSFRGGCASSI